MSLKEVNIGGFFGIEGNFDKKFIRGQLRVYIPNGNVQRLYSVAQWSQHCTGIAVPQLQFLPKRLKLHFRLGLIKEL